jgi:UTP--glucose-1-phosphate uridylyltransferase
VPIEFEATSHYLKDDHGNDIEPKATIPEAAEATEATEETDWGPPMLGALIVNLATFIGVFLLFPPVKKMSARPVFGAMLFAFAAGALLACAFFLLLFEATHLVAVGWSAEVDVVWRWGTMT